MKRMVFQGIVLIAFVMSANAETVMYETQIQPVFNANCIRCHGGAGGLNLEADVSKKNLVDVVSKSYAPALRVKMGDLQSSVLYHKITDTGKYGGVMPKDTGKMAQENIDLISSWIAPQPTACAATIDGTLTLHIPYLSAVILSQTVYLSADFVLDLTQTQQQLVFRLTSAGFISDPAFSCSASTLSDNLKIHIPDLLLPDGTSHFWIDMAYDAVHSNGGNFYWNVVDYGNIS